jgi:hypothetical protein
VFRFQWLACGSAGAAGDHF